MANTSIFAAFERFWQHVVVALGDKADADHSHTFLDISDGTLAVENGGTDADNSVDALKNLVAGNVGESLPAAGNTGRMFFLPASKAGFAPATESTDYPGCYYRTVDGVAEWINPPMVYGEEYRTTERFNGKPVYIKAVRHGALSTGSQTIAHGISNIDEVVGLDVMNSTYGFFSHSSDVRASADRTNVNINSAWNMGGCIYVIKYTK